MASNECQIRDSGTPCLCVCFDALKWNMNFEELCTFLWKKTSSETYIIHLTY